MQITIANENYKTLSSCLLGLHTYFFTLNYRFPPEIAEERLLCMMLVLQTLCDKILAYQPAQESVSHTIKAALQHYFMLKDKAQSPTLREITWFEQMFAASQLVKHFVQDGAVNDISGYLNQTLRRNALDALRQEVPQTGKALSKCSIDEIAQGKAVLSSAECAKCWAHYGPLSDSTANRVKNALVRGKYLVLLEDETLMRALSNKSLYVALDGHAKRICVGIITAVFPLMDDAQKQQIEQLANDVMLEYRIDLLSLRHRNHGEQYGLMDLFHAGNKTQLKQGLLDFGQALVHDKGVCFYINYDLSSISWSELDDFSESVNSLTELLHCDFLQHQDQRNYALWENDTFKIIWLISVVWFRKLFHELQNSSARAGK